MTILFTANGAMALRDVRERTADTTITTTDAPTTVTPPIAGQTYWDLIDRSDAALLDFSTDTLEHDIDHARALLAQHPAIYRNQLTIAKFIEGWVDRLERDAKPCRFNEGFVEALAEVAQHLRDGDFAEGPVDDVGHAPPV